jgi:hypothetical protein
MWSFEHEDKMHYSLQQLFIGLFILLNDEPKRDNKLY